MKEYHNVNFLVSYSHQDDYGKHNQVPLEHGPIWHDIVHSTAVTTAEYKSKFKLPTDTP